MTWMNPLQMYKGDWMNNQPHGTGEHVWDKISGTIYEECNDKRKPLIISEMGFFVVVLQI